MFILNLILLIIPLVLIVWWVTKIKTGEKYTRADIIKLLIFGGLALALDIAIALLLAIGWKVLQPAGTPALVNGLIMTVFTAALPEECAKYLMFRLGTRNHKQMKMKVWLDAVLACGLVGMGFDFFENIEYAIGGDAAMMTRGFLPFHFLFAVVMGYYFGKALLTGDKKYHIRSIAVPVLMHSVLDFPIITVTNWPGGDAFEILNNADTAPESEVIFIMVLLGLILLITVAYIILLILAFRRIKKWSRTAASQALLYPSEEDAAAPELVPTDMAAREDAASPGLVPTDMAGKEDAASPEVPASADGAPETPDENAGQNQKENS